MSNGAYGLEEHTRGIPKLIIEDMNEELLRLVSATEIKKAAFSLGALKALRVDGLKGLFYQKHWDDIGHDVYTAVKFFFQTGELPEEVN